MTTGWEEIESGDERSGLVGDGETFAVFRLTQASLDNLLNSAPPWSAQWQKGPVPAEVGLNCRFGTDRVYAESNKQVSGYSGNKTLIHLLGSQQILFDAKQRCCDTMPWHNGNLIIIDPSSRTVWLSAWDF